MLLTTIGEAFEINPQVRIPKGTEVPFVSMDQVVPGQRNVSTAEKRLFKGGSKFEHGDTLMARITPCLENKKIAQYLPPNHASPSAGSTEFIVIRGKNGVSITPFAYYFVQSPDIHELAISLMTGTSGRQRVDTEAFRMSEIWLPNLTTQEKIVKVLGSLDDKIAVNNKMIRIILELQKSIWIQNNVKNLSQIHLINIAEPILGGTPKRSDNSLWNGDILWASVADMTSVSNSHLLTTTEQITEKAAETKRFAPLPAGSVLLSARGTVGHVISLAIPAAFNQSAYGFIAPKGYETALRLAIEDTVEELKSKSYGSVFSTITKQQINECLIPDVFNESFAELHAKLNSLETRIVIAEQENQTLARTRDELLPLLMSGKITVRDAEEASAEVGVDKHEVEE